MTNSGRIEKAKQREKKTEIDGEMKGENSTKLEKCSIGEGEKQRKDGSTDGLFL